MRPSFDDVLARAIASLRAGNLEDAEGALKECLSRRSQHFSALNLYSVVLMTLGKYEEASVYAKKALRENPKSEVTLYNYGLILRRLKRPIESLAQFDRALAIDPTVAETWNNRGAALYDLKRYQEAIAAFDRAIALNPQYFEALCNKGNALSSLESRALALAAYNRALGINSRCAEAWGGRGRVLSAEKRYIEAIESFDKALSFNPEMPEIWNNKGVILTQLATHHDALVHYNKAIELRADYSDALCNRANAQFALKDYESALESYNQALNLKPDFAQAWAGRGNVFLETKRYAEAYEAYNKASKANPGLDYLAGQRVHLKALLCDWNGLEDDFEAILATVREGGLPSHPFPLLSMPSTRTDQLHVARQHVAKQLVYPSLCGQDYPHDRIRIAYLSPDLGDHPVSQQMVGIFEQHDRSRFEVTAISFGPLSQSPLGARTQAAFDRFIDVRNVSDLEAAKTIRNLEIDIAVDLAGFTQGGRPNILAHRPAPVQVSYLGYSGTMGAPYIDYIIADETVIPREHFESYSEKVVWLPDSMMPNDAMRDKPHEAMSREDCGLPTTGFVFCSFNNTYKILPSVFRTWMKLLRSVPGSVLWLAEPQIVAKKNLEESASKCGISPERLIFAPRLTSMADHLSRLRLADLFLDTVPYNGHVTVSDALWAEVPVLTCLGSTFAGRVAASQLKAVNLQELIADSLDAYERLALDLIADPPRLSAIRSNLACASTAPLFDTVRLCCQLEALFVHILEKPRAEAPFKAV